MTGPLKYLRRPFEANVEAGQRVLLVTDTAQDARVWQAAMMILADLDADTTLAMFEPRPADYYDPPEVVRQAMGGADWVVLMASTAMGHSPSAMAAMGGGTPMIQIDGHLTLEMFQRGAATADYHAIARARHYVAKNLYGPDAKEVRVTSDFGMDLVYGVEGRVVTPPLRPDDWNPYQAYRRTEDGRKGSPRYLVLFPGGEHNVPPVEGTGEGTIVVDTTMHHLGRLEAPVTLVIKEGRIRDIRGGADAKRLRDHLERHGDESAYMCPTEASIGLNPNAMVTGEQREDKNILGSMHFGLGTNSDVGGTVQSLLHMDGVVLQPTMYVDGVKRIDRGRILVPLDRDA